MYQPKSRHNFSAFPCLLFVEQHNHLICAQYRDPYKVAQ